MLFFVLFCWKYRWWFLSFSFVIVVMYSISCVISNCYHLLLYQGSFAYIVYIACTLRPPVSELPKLSVWLYCTVLNWYYRTDCYLSLLIYGYIVTGTFDSDLIIVDTDILFYYYYYYYYYCFCYTDSYHLLLFIIVITTTLGDRTYGLVVVLVSCCALSTLGDILSVVVWSVRSLLL